MKTTVECNHSISVDDFIRTIRESFVGSQTVYTQGSCYQFHRILAMVWPQAVAYYDSNHVITEIGGKYYDITGEVQPERHLRMSEHYPDNDVRSMRYDMWHRNAYYTPLDTDDD